MARSATISPDPALERLREVAERIRRRAAAGRPRRSLAAAPVLAPVPAPRGAPPPPHWADGPDRGTDDGSH